MQHIETIDSLNDRAFSNIYKDFSLADKLSREASLLAKEKSYTKGIAWSLLNRGLLDIENGYTDQAESKFRQALHIFLDLNETNRGIIVAYNSLGLINIRLGNMKEAFTYLDKALNCGRKQRYKDLEFTTMNYFGILQYKTENYNQALRFFKKTLSLAANENHTAIFNNLGCTYRALKKYDIALEYLNKALKEADTENRKGTRVAILEELGLTFTHMERYEEGIDSLNKALNECTDFHKRYRLSISIHLGELYIKKNNYSAAESALNQAREYFTDSNAINNRKLFLLLSKISERKGDYITALDHYREYHKLYGKVKSTDLDEKIWQMETEQLNKMNHRITTISEMGKKMTALLERKEVIETLLESLKSLFSVDFCIFGEIDESSRILKAELFNIPFGKRIDVELNCMIPRNIESWVSEHRTGLLLSNIPSEYKTYFSSLDNSHIPESVSSVICLPFETGEIRGVIGIYSRERNKYNNEDREFLEMLSSFAAIALNNTAQTSAIKGYNAKLEKMNKFDDLTGIFNRRHLLSQLELRWNISKRNLSWFHLLLLDLDLFKKINDTYGHEAGDLCLKSTSVILKDLLQRSADGFGRYGGEEFIVFIEGVEPGEALNMAEKIRKTIENNRIILGKQNINITASIGLISIRNPGNEKQTFQSIINDADKNMYSSKNRGRNRTTQTILQ